MTEKQQGHTLAALKGRPTNVPEIVDYILANALKLGASDIHIGHNRASTLNDPYLLRFRIHGKLQIVRSDFLNNFYRESVARIKVLAGINTTDVNVPLDGQIQVNTPEGVVTMRIATIPCEDAEEVVIRIQKTYKMPTLERLFMTHEMLQQMNLLIRQKSGMIILNGPAGSGKTTTIQAIIGALASPEKKIITAEDPIETHLPFVSHTQISNKTSFASLSRAFMRQDADVIFIGEIRDAESAEAAIQLAQTGHLVLTTLHTRDSFGVISRLEAFGIHPNFIATSLLASLAQRLVPRICKHCRLEHSPPEKMIQDAAHAYPIPQGTVFYKAGTGCPNCHGGIVGRIPIFELLVADGELCELVNRRGTKLDLVQLARSKGMKTLPEEALIRVYSGYVELDSVYHYITGPSYEF